MPDPNTVIPIKISGDLTRAELEKFIQDNESQEAEFVFIERDEDDKKFNKLYFELHHNEATRQRIILQPVPKDADERIGGLWVDALIDGGFSPFKTWFDCVVAGKHVSLCPCRQGPVPQLADPGTGWITTIATVFGLNMNGTHDQADNGRGSPALGYINTRDADVVGCALPAAVLRARFGSIKAARDRTIRVRKDGTVGEGIVAKIVDVGPSTAQVAKGVALDLTLGAQLAIGGDGFTKVNYHFV